eukprot:1828511-Amphidinium_carterae.1
MGAREIVLAAVSDIGVTLKYASEELKDDMEIVQTAIASSPYALEFANSHLRNSRELGLAAVRANPYAFEILGQALLAEVSFCEEARLLFHVVR